jgi:hypothetical protein
MLGFLSSRISQPRPLILKVQTLRRENFARGKTVNLLEVFRKKAATLSTKQSWREGDSLFLIISA